MKNLDLDKNLGHFWTNGNGTHIPLYTNGGPEGPPSSGIAGIIVELEKIDPSSPTHTFKFYYLQITIITMRFEFYANSPQ